MITTARQWVFLALGVSAAVFFLQCMGGGVNTGNAHGNAVTGRLVQWNQANPSRCAVYLYKANAQPPLPPEPDTNCLRTTSPDAGGTFYFRNVPLGIYTIIGRDSVQKTATILNPIVIADTIDTTVDIGTDTLTKATSLAGMVHRLPLGYTAFCYVAGSPYNTLSDTSQDTAAHFILADLPSHKVFDVQAIAIPPKGLGKTCSATLNLKNGLPDTLTFEPIQMPCPFP
jgi:hypothetical protein